MESVKIEIMHTVKGSWHILHEKRVFRTLLLVGCINGLIFCFFYTSAYIRLSEYPEESTRWLQMLADPASTKFYFAIAAFFPVAILTTRQIDYLFRRCARPRFFYDFHPKSGVLAASILMFFGATIEDYAINHRFEWATLVWPLSPLGSWLVTTGIFISVRLAMTLFLIVPIMAWSTQGRIPIAQGWKWLTSSFPSLAGICLLAICGYHFFYILNVYVLDFLSSIIIDNMPDHPEWGILLNWQGGLFVPHILAPYFTIPIAAHFRVWSKHAKGQKF
ncbi:hypothetical protein L2D14_07855 [Thalassospiraceae bacterium LMO-JJ14]|nr:hypothetical protein L2D14_07855 [Thalassospiraceae bacterium LMO-JJ14]